MTSQVTVEAPVGRRGSRRVQLAGAFLGAAAAIGIGALLLWSPHRSNPSRSAVALTWARPTVNTGGLVERSGVKLTRVVVTGDGGLVDLRYLVVDASRANALHDKKTPPGLVDEQSGLVVNQLFMDHAHTGPHKAGETYYLVFNNPGNSVHRGTKVTVLLGDAQVEHVVVR
jgi:hypothetical protein